MPRLFAFTAAILGLIVSTQAHGVPGGEIGTLPLGDYECALPGDAAGPANIAVPTENFSVINASSYRTQGVHGTYLLTGDRLVMTSGPFNGKRFRRISRRGLLKSEPDGEDSELRCVLTRSSGF